MEPTKEFLEASRSKYKNLAAMVLQFILQKEMTRLHGDAYLAVLRKDIKLLAEDEDPHFLPFFRKEGEEFSLESMDVSVICAYIREYELISDEEKLEIVELLRELRNLDGHSVNRKEDTSSEDERFWKTACVLLKKAESAFGITGDLARRIGDFCQGKNSVGANSMRASDRLEYAQRLFSEWKNEEAMSVLEKLMVEHYGPAFIAMAKLYCTETGGVEKYDLQKALELVQKAAEHGASNAQRVEQNIKIILKLTELRSQNLEAALELANLHKTGDYLPNRWEYILDCYLAAKEQGWQDFDKVLREELYNNGIQDVLWYYDKQGETDKIKEYFHAIGDEKAADFLLNNYQKMGHEMRFLYYDYLMQGKGCEKDFDRAYWRIAGFAMPHKKREVSKDELPLYLKYNLYLARCCNALTRTGIALVQVENFGFACRFGMKNSDNPEFKEHYDAFVNFLKVCVRNHPVEYLRLASECMSAEEKEELCDIYWNKIRDKYDKEATCSHYFRYDDLTEVRNGITVELPAGEVMTDIEKHHYSDEYVRAYEHKELFQIDSPACMEALKAYRFYDQIQYIKETVRRFEKKYFPLDKYRYENLSYYERELERERKKVDIDIETLGYAFWSQPYKEIEEFFENWLKHCEENKAYFNGYLGYKRDSFYVSEEAEQMIAEAKERQKQYGEYFPDRDGKFWLDKRWVEIALERRERDLERKAKKKKLTILLTSCGIGLAAVGTILYFVLK